MKRFLYIIIILVTLAVLLLSIFAINNGGQIEYFNLKNTDSNSTSTFSDSNPNKREHITIVVGGDVMFDRNIRYRGQQNGYTHFFDNLRDFFTKADIVVANLEGPITSSPSETFLSNGTYSKELKFTFATTTAKALKEIGIDIVSLANNHTDNFGYAGLLETRKWLTENNVRYFGDPWNSSSTEALVEIDGIKIAFVGYHYFISGIENVLNDVGRLSDAGYFVIVMPHWGEEYVYNHSPKMEYIAQQFIARGADAIIGAHPHVIMDHQWIGDVPVFYSLGNLLFDQYFSKEVMKGNILRLTLTRTGLGQRLESVEVFDVYNSPSEKLRFDGVPVDIEVI